MTSLLERWGARVDVSGGSDACWIWIGALNPPGAYGVIWHEGANLFAHRASWILFRFPIPSDLCVLHRCDVRHCVNPDHLFLGTKAENMADRDAKGRNARGENHPKAKLTLDDVRAIRESRLPQRALASQYAVTQTNIKNIQHRKIWKEA